MNAGTGNNWDRRVWLIPRTRRVLILCSFFPYDRDSIQLYSSMDSNSLEEALDELHQIGGCLDKDDGNNPQPSIRAEFRPEVEETIASELCLPNESLDTLKGRMESMFSEDRIHEYLESLVEVNNGFFGLGFIGGTKVKRVEDCIYAVDYGKWTAVVGAPVQHRQGCLREQNELEHFYFSIAELLEEPGSIPRVKMFFAPSFSPEIARRAGARSIGVQLIDWLNILHIQAFQAKHGRLKPDNTDKASAIFTYGHAGLGWDYKRIDDFWERYNNV